MASEAGETHENLVEAISREDPAPGPECLREQGKAGDEAREPDESQQAAGARGLGQRSVARLIPRFQNSSLIEQARTSSAFAGGEARGEISKAAP